MVKLNPHFLKFKGQKYLFREIGDIRAAFLEENPDKEVEYIKLGIGNTTLPLPHVIGWAMSQACLRLTQAEPFTEEEMQEPPSETKREIRRLMHETGLDTYNGYGNEPGSPVLRRRINEVKYGSRFDPSEIFISDGAKPDSANIQQIFALESRIALQCPSYPVYEGSNVIAGRATGPIDPETGRFPGFQYLECGPENGFFPNLDGVQADILYLCSPNNPTGAGATHDQLKKGVDWALANKAIIMFDSAYSRFIDEKGIPKSIYEIDGAEKCAIEIGSFSKDAGFTGARLGWTVVPKTLEVVENYVDAETQKEEDWLTAQWAWNKRVSTMFNGAANIVQVGGLAALTEEGIRETQWAINTYRENARIIKGALLQAGFEEVYGAENSPYVWAPIRGSSWQFLERSIADTCIECTPGAGFGGEGYIRLSGFGSRAETLKAADRIRKYWGALKDVA